MVTSPGSIRKRRRRANSFGPSSNRVIPRRIDSFSNQISVQLAEPLAGLAATFASTILKDDGIKIDNQIISEVLTVNGVRFSLEDGSWGLIRASSNKPSLVIVTESPTSDKRKLQIFRFIDQLLQKTGKIGEYDQKI